MTSHSGDGITLDQQQMTSFIHHEINATPGPAAERLKCLKRKFLRLGLKFWTQTRWNLILGIIRLILGLVVIKVSC